MKARYSIEQRGAFFALTETTTGNTIKVGSWSECDAYAKRMQLHYAKEVAECA